MEEHEGLPQHPLNERLEAIEHNIANLSKDLGDLQYILLATRRYIAEHSIEQLRMYLGNWILQHNNEVMNRWPEAELFVQERAAIAKDRVSRTDTPIDIARRYEHDCVEAFKKHNLSAFRE